MDAANPMTSKQTLPDVRNWPIVFIITEADAVQLKLTVIGSTSSGRATDTDGTQFRDSLLSLNRVVIVVSDGLFDARLSPVR